MTELHARQGIHARWRPCHYSPFAFPILDQVCIGEIGRGRKFVSAGEVFSETHFPGAPVLPGVVIVGAVVCVAMAMSALPGGAPKLRRVHRFRFCRPVFPGDLLELEVSPLATRGSFEGRATVAGALVAHGRVDIEC